MKELLFETDWLASRPVFYNEKTMQASYNINDVIDLLDLEWHPEGFNNYLDFGYSVFEQTPAKHVKFMRYSSRLWRESDGRLKIEYMDDPVDKWLDYRLSESDVIELIRSRVQEWEKHVEGKIVVPTSGGFDSRLLNWCVKDKTRIQAFTYGLSENQTESYEVVYAKKMCEILGVDWRQIELGEFHHYLNDWDKMFGVSTHAHGMYHIEFYKKIIRKGLYGSSLLSGIVGDAWAGSINPPIVREVEQLPELGYTHGLNADVFASTQPGSWEMRHIYINDNDDKMHDERWRVVFLVRLKILLLSYLLTVPRMYGLKPWSPFLDIDICMAMLNLPKERRLNRLWQKEFFERENLNIEDIGLQCIRDNRLNNMAMKKIPLNPLDKDLLKVLLKEKYVEEINGGICKASRENIHFRQYLQRVPKWPGMWRIHARVRNRDQKLLSAYCAYLTLKPLASLLQRQKELLDEG